MYKKINKVKMAVKRIIMMSFIIYNNNQNKNKMKLKKKILFMKFIKKQFWNY